ncbi:MAG: glutathione S-transferase family protein [Deltaproteobacteria bacterium]|nr:glutathione S-transferase family protein [Deltaproteobacteria bacterium]
MILFYGAPMSSAGRTHAMLEETGVPYEYVRVGPMTGGTRTPEYLAINPAGKVPFLIDGDVRLGESIAINFYLAERYVPAMWSSDLSERALIYQWSLWAITNVQPEVLTVMFHSAMLPEPQRIPALVDKAKERLVPLLDHFDRALEGREHLVGDRYTVADLNAASVLNLARAMSLEGDRPRLRAWLDRARARPAWQRAAAAG